MRIKGLVLCQDVEDSTPRGFLYTLFSVEITTKLYLLQTKIVLHTPTGLQKVLCQYSNSSLLNRVRFPGHIVNRDVAKHGY